MNTHLFWDYPYLFGLIGIVGLYRYSLWLTHLVRALIYEKITYAKLRKQADFLPENVWKPEKLYFIVASYREDRQILYNSIKSIVHEARHLGLPAIICLGSADSHDERIAVDALKNTPHSENIRLVIVRQDTPGKRFQLGRALRALVREGIAQDDPVVFMDGDSVIAPGCMRKCLSVFGAKPDIRALTTNNRALISESRFLAGIFNLKFALRNLHMHSLALSERVLCLTGRFSVFRAGDVTEESFISRLETDYINDDYWGKIMFLSGDDKSTWFSLLQKQAKMLYIPDAFVYTIEKVKKTPIYQYIDNLKRWNGNTLRNSSRAIALGPWSMGFFPWLILIDQKINMWTALLSPTFFIIALFTDLRLLYLLIAWILITRCLQSLLLFYYGRAVNLFFPFLLYFNQVLNGFVKIYISFHLNAQQWSSRELVKRPVPSGFYRAFAGYMTAVYLVIFFLVSIILHDKLVL